EKIEVQVGRTGRITPVARVQPVRVAGSTISNATLHNQEYVDLLELAEGDTVAVSKRGDVIPAVERVVEKNAAGRSTWRMPAVCPSCGGKLVKIGAHHFCPTADCPDKLKGTLRFFAGRDQMDIENLGPETVDLLFEQGLVRLPEDIYRFDPDKLAGLPGFGEKKIRLLREGIEKSKERPYPVVLAALGIPELGKRAAELLIEAGFTSIDMLLDIADKDDPLPLQAVKGIGEKLSLTILRALKDPVMRRRISALKEAGLSFTAASRPRENLPQIFQGQVWCVTGSLNAFKPREKAMDEVKKRGGSVSQSVSSRTTHLLAGREAGSKLTKAEALGTKIVSEDEFLSLLST
ncbi:MAG TPA: DNA ligase (NAD(+)) LigA, partial [Spirochaetia bacterium]|nr:DNA ligase (NAD(+)) LigA [Spirochaetia bacterium]